MKRKLALPIILVLTLILTLTLTACSNQTPTTGTTCRWDAEEHTFNISMARAVGADYAQSYTKDINGKVYFRDFDIQTSRAIETFASVFRAERDEVLPENVKGTYKTKIAPSEDKTSYCEYSTEQILYVQYKKSVLQSSENWQDLQACEAPANENPFDNGSDYITLKSVTKTYVKFQYNNKQQPMESLYDVDGFYIGSKTEQNVSKVTVKTVYESGVAKVSVNGEEVKEIKLNISSAQNYIDSCQILLYLRSLDKSSNGFQDSPSVMVYNPLTNEVAVTAFAKSDANAVINKNASGVSDDDIYVNLNVISVSVGSSALLVQENLPVLANTDKLIGEFTDARFTTVRFRSGYLVYEIADFFSDGIIADLATYTADKNK